VQGFKEKNIQSQTRAIRARYMTNKHPCVFHRSNRCFFAWLFIARYRSPPYVSAVCLLRYFDSYAIINVHCVWLVCYPFVTVTLFHAKKFFTLLIRHRFKNV